MIMQTFYKGHIWGFMFLLTLYSLGCRLDPPEWETITIENTLPVQYFDWTRNYKKLVTGNLGTCSDRQLKALYVKGSDFPPTYPLIKALWPEQGLTIHYGLAEVEEHLFQPVISVHKDQDAVVWQSHVPLPDEYRFPLEDYGVREIVLYQDHIKHVLTSIPSLDPHYHVRVYVDSLGIMKVDSFFDATPNQDDPGR